MTSATEQLTRSTTAKADADEGTKDRRRTGSRRSGSLATIGTAALLMIPMGSPAFAATCEFVGGPQFGGIEPPIEIDATGTEGLAEALQARGCTAQLESIKSQ